jgi:cation:H+ antiporter
VAWYQLRRKRSGHAGEPWAGIRLDREHAIELSFLAAATLYSLSLPLKGSITLVDAAVLVGIFVLYTIRVSRAPAEEPHLVGPARWVGGFRVAGRQASVVGLFVAAGAVILLVAEPFAEALVATGTSLGVSEFLLVQWLAPLASEAPELIIAGLYAWRLNMNTALGTLVSSKVNQWTLLVGTLPIVFAFAAGGVHGLPLDGVQREELFLTAAQSFFAIAVLINLTLSVRDATWLLSLFWIQFVFGAVLPEQAREAERIGIGVVYLLLGVWTVIRHRADVPHLFRDGLRTPYAKLAERGDGDPT